MGYAITVMNAKGGVGKSTLVLALAETLAVHHRQRVLVIDSDAHASVSTMLMALPRLAAAQDQGRTVVDYFAAIVLKGVPAKVAHYVVGSVSDVDDARTIDILPGGGHLTLFEREVSAGRLEPELRRAVREFLAEVVGSYDMVLIDSAPGLSVLTECWLREANYYLAPTKPDYISTRGLQFLGQFRQRDLDMGFAQFLGVIINMADPHSGMDDQFEHWLRQHRANRCFQQPIRRATALQTAAHFYPRARSYWAKYPGDTGRDLRQLTVELLARLSSTPSHGLAARK
jgi:chromosome partitioning protein